jgi:hypothetical protein
VSPAYAVRGGLDLPVHLKKIQTATKARSIPPSPAPIPTPAAAPLESPLEAAACIVELLGLEPVIAEPFDGEPVKEELVELAVREEDEGLLVNELLILEELDEEVFIELLCVGEVF